MWQDKNMRKEHLEEENCQGGLQQEKYLDGQTRGTTKNTGEDWRRIGDGGIENNHEKEKWKQLRKKKKLRKKNQELESGQKKTTMKWATWLTHTTSYRKFLGMRKLKRGVVS